MTNLLFSADLAVKSVWEKVMTFNGIVAGGAVADAYFKVGAKDIDVFVSSNHREEVYKFVENNRFVNASHLQEQPRAFGFDSYGRSSMGGRSKNIIEVFKGFVLGYPVDIVMVSERDPREHVKTFDLNIKQAYYDGLYHYTKGFMKDITDNTVSCSAYEPTGYIRAKLAADKYEMEIGKEFELSRNYIAYVKEQSRFDMIPAKYRDHVESNDFGDYNIAKVQAADLYTFYAGMRSVGTPAIDPVIWGLHYLNRTVSKEKQTHHPITRQSFEIELESANYIPFHQLTWKIYSDTVDVLSPFEESKEGKDLQALHDLSKEDFIEGMVTDENGRRVKINKFINKLMKRYKEHASSFEALKRYVETRGAKSTTEVKFSGSTYDLLRISTGRAWVSCQRWELGMVTDLNTGVLGNLGGATVVGYFPNEKGEWAGRFLVRLGEDNSLFLEGIYSNRTELLEDQTAILNRIGEKLREAGFTVYKSIDLCDSKFDFKGLPMAFKPYNDVGVRLDMRDGGYVFQSKKRRAKQETVTELGEPVGRYQQVVVAVQHNPNDPFCDCPDCEEDLPF
jgi:hypothetical protein